MIFFTVCNIFFEGEFEMFITKGYIAGMEKPIPAFSKALAHFISTGKNITQAKISAETKIKQSMISGMKTGKRAGTEKTRRLVAAFFNKEYEEFLKIGEKLLTAETNIDVQPTPPETNVSTIEHEHVKVVQQFQQKELALEINHLLLEIEQHNPSLLEVIKQQLSGLAATCYPAPQKKRS
jgi:transcriptional regulator with XRE-family HTH domain